MIRIGIVDDDGEMRKVITRVLSKEPNMEVAASFCSGEEAIEKMPSVKPDIVLMDINLSGLNGIETTARLSQTLPETKFVMITVFEDPDMIFDALKAGADGYMLKSMAAKDLINSINEALNGGAPMSASIARKVVSSFRQAAPTQTSDDYNLSPREKEVLDLMAKGLIHKEISSILDISVKTVGTYVERIYQKLRVRSKTEAVVKYLGKD